MTVAGACGAARRSDLSGSWTRPARAGLPNPFRFLFTALRPRAGLRRGFAAALVLLGVAALVPAGPAQAQAITGFTVTPVPPHTLRVSWSAYSGATHYVVRLFLNGNQLTSTGNITDTSHDFTGLARGRNYRVTVEAVNAQGPIAGSLVSDSKMVAPALSGSFLQLIREAQAARRGQRSFDERYQFKYSVSDVTLIGPQEENINGDNHVLLTMPEMYFNDKPAPWITYKLTSSYLKRPYGAFSSTSLPPGLSFNPATRALTATWYCGSYEAELSWTASYQGEARTETFKVTNVTQHCDGGSATGQDDSQQAGGNTPPVFVSGTEAQSATAGTAFSYTVPEARDKEGHTVTYTATLHNGNDLPAWLSFNTSTRVLSGTPAAGDAGTLELAVTATDDGDPPKSATEYFTLKVKAGGVQNSPGLRATKPTANAGADQDGKRGGTVTLSGSGTRHARGSQDALTYSWRIQSASNTALAGTGSRLGGANKATATWTVPKRKDMTDRSDVDNGETVTFELTVTDGDGETATDTVTVTIDGSTWTAGGTEQATEEAETEEETEDETPPTPTPPTANAGADKTGKRGGTVTLRGAGTLHDDGSQSALTYSWRIQAASNTALAGTGSRLSDANKATATWTVPKRKDVTDRSDMDDGQTVTFELTVTDGDNETATDTVTVTIQGSTWKAVSLSVADASANETAGAIAFTVSLSQAARDAVSVDYKTSDGTALAGADYTAASGTLTFQPGQTSQTVSVTLNDDVIDDTGETFTLTLENPVPAGTLQLADATATGTITNSDPLQTDWLARFGRAAASDAIAAVTARLATPRDAGSHLTVGGHRVPLAGDGAATMAGTGAPSDGWPDGGPADGRRPPGQTLNVGEMLRGSSFRAVFAADALTGAQWTGWGQGAAASQFSSAGPGLTLTGQAATGAMGMDYERGPLLTGFALTHSLGTGTAAGAGRSYRLESAVTAVLPYARVALSDRVTAWGLAGTGRGRMTLAPEGGPGERHRADLAMTLAAAGVKGDLLTPAAAGGFTLALKADAFWVRTESESVSELGVGNLAGARTDASRVRLALTGTRTLSLAGARTLTPSLELGLRHDGGDAETGMGLEFGAGLGYRDPASGLDVALRGWGLAAHVDGGYREWGVSGSLRYVPDASGRGLSASLTPAFGAEAGGTDLWHARDATALAQPAGGVRAARLDMELGYGFGAPAFTGTVTPYTGLALMGPAGRTLRVGTRWAWAPNALLSLEGARREAAATPADHGVLLQSAWQW